MFPKIKAGGIYARSSWPRLLARRAQAAVRKPPVQTGERDGYWNDDSSYHGVTADAFGVGLALAISSPAVCERLLP